MAETIGLAGIIVDKRKNEQFNYDSDHIKNSGRLSPLFMYIKRSARQRKILGITLERLFFLQLLSRRTSCLLQKIPG